MSVFTQVVAIPKVAGTVKTFLRAENDQQRFVYEVGNISGDTVILRYEIGYPCMNLEVVDLSYSFTSPGTVYEDEEGNTRVYINLVFYVTFRGKQGEMLTYNSEQGWQIVSENGLKPVECTSF